MDRQLGNLRENMPGESRALVPPDGIVHLAPIDDAHEEFALAIDGELNELLDFFGSGTVSRKRHDGAGVENDALHSFRSRRRSSRRISGALESLPRQPRRLRINSGVSGWRMRRFSSSTKTTCVPFLMEYLRRSFEGMTSWPFVVTVETSVFIRTPTGRIRNKYTDDGNVSQVHLQLTFLASVRHPGEEHSPVRQAQGKGAGGMKAKRGEERFMAQVDKRRREISLCAGRPLRRSEAGRKSRPAS